MTIDQEHPSTPQIGPMNLVTPSEPTMNQNGNVTLTVARHEDTIAGHLIVTFAKRGSLTCSDLLSCKSTSELLLRAEKEGTKTDEPALLATVDDHGTARTVYLTPLPNNNFRDFAIWVGQVTDTLTNLKARNLGFYLCKESLGADALSELMGQVIRSIVEAKLADDICLVVGNHAYNEILETALSLKHELDGVVGKVHVLH